jgi:hypothetical protein
VLELLEQEDKKKEIKWIETGNEEDKLSLFAYNMVLYLNDPKDSTRKLTSDKHCQQSSGIQNQHTKISIFSTYQ